MPERTLSLTVLAIEKTVSAAFFFAAAAVMLVLRANNVTHPLQALFAEELREDPHDLLATWLIGLVPQVSRTALLTLAFISVGYLVLQTIEAAGLWRGQLWVEYLILVETAAFLPYEAYEIVRQPTVFKVAILPLNVVIVVYLARRRLRSRRPFGTACWQH